MSDTAPDTATTARYPDLTHRTQAEAMADEANMDQVFAAIRAERCRQIEAGHTPAADDRLRDDDLINAALAYIDAAAQIALGRGCTGKSSFSALWRIGAPTPAPTAIANLTRACALLVAEIERQRRAAMRPVSAPTAQTAGPVEPLEV